MLDGYLPAFCRLPSSETLGASAHHPPEGNLMHRLPRALLPVALIGGLLLPAAPAIASRGTFDIQGHRGGLGLTVESTIASFTRGLEVGVSTLELDVQITQDGYAVVTHDRKIGANKCRDT